MAIRLGLPADPDLVEQLRIGMEIEHEHDDVTGGNKMATAKIAARHLREDPLYYMPLLAIERYRERQGQSPRVLVSIDHLPDGYVVTLGVEGVPMPIWGTAFADPQQAVAVAEFLRSRPALAIVYAWMMITHPEG